MVKMGPKMVAQCASAVGIIYSAGYAVTETPAIAKDSPASIASTQTIHKVAAAKPSMPVPQNTAKNQAHLSPPTQNIPNNPVPKASASTSLKVQMTKEIGDIYEHNHENE